ncbi:sister chromatid cohesion protein PDS5 homolog C-like isoform X2 [Apium graveolens]|uniref:sister chromatid cohesion protein PDS5 homolog C-like isoform X2 n=1 Tax=Apium graveolens TaxID=4045 RepID=UPI003D7C0101
MSESDTSSGSYQKSVSILENFARVRVGIIMLDLECHGLIYEMFQHFLSSIRDCHPEDVFIYMETIMTYLLEESDDVSMELLTPMLASQERNNEEITTSARKLGESVFMNCADKLKPYMKKAVKSQDLPLDGYSEVVAKICSESSDEVEHNSENTPTQKEKREAAELVSKPFRHDDEIVSIDQNDQDADETAMPATKRRRHLTTQDIQTEIDDSASGDNAPVSGNECVSGGYKRCRSISV